MQKVEKLTSVLRDLLSLVDEEAAENPVFAERLAALTAGLPPPTRAARSRKRTRPATAPDIFVALQEKGEEEFRFWLRSLDVPTLKAIVKANGFDTTRNSAKWTDAEKFVPLIVDQTLSRVRRGSGFLPPKMPPAPPPNQP